MIQLPDIPLTSVTADGLRVLQAEVDTAGSYAERVAEGKRLFSLRNTRGNAIFDDVKRTLDRMCSGAGRCAYCEDSRADEVEHVRPKALYPEVVFAWNNYVYACGPCNGPKGNHFAVFVVGTVAPVEVARKPKAPVEPPLEGEPVLFAEAGGGRMSVALVLVVSNSAYVVEIGMVASPGQLGTDVQAQRPDGVLGASVVARARGCQGNEVIRFSEIEGHQLRRVFRPGIDPERAQGSASRPVTGRVSLPG